MFAMDHADFYPERNSPRRSLVRIRLGPILIAWLVLVLCRIGMRLFSVGTGTRSTLGLASVTAAVNAYWLVIGPAFVAACRMTRRFTARYRWPVVALLALGVTALEPLWYFWMVRVFHGTPAPWAAAVVARADVNLLIVALIVAAEVVSEEFEVALDRQRQRDALESLLVDTEVRALTLQLQPHFLFNTLQLAAEAAYEDIAAARRVVGDLHRLLRRTFAFEEQSLVPLVDEIDFLQSYIAIQRRRFGSRLTVELHVDPGVRELLLPPLLLQPIVENSIQHGLGPLARDGKIVIRASRASSHLCLTVQDNGVGLHEPQVAAGGLGLGVTRRRLAALFPGQHRIDIQNVETGGAIVSIEIPTVSVATRSADPTPMAGGSHEDARWWSVRGAIVAGIGIALVLGNITGAALLVDRYGNASRPTPPGSIAVWVPVQLLVLALTVVLWRARSIRRWLHDRDAEANHLRAQVAEARARVGALRSGKELMLTSLARLSKADTPADFDDIILNTSQLIRRILTLAHHGHSSVELEVELTRRSSPITD